MSKDQELAVLDGAIARLGAHSYVGPWLSKVRSEVAADMRNDLPPAPSWSRTRIECEEYRKQAQAQAEALITTAKAAAESDLRDALGALADRLRTATGLLTRLAEETRQAEARIMNRITRLD